jgi:hypothetical protein
VDIDSFGEAMKRPVISSSLLRQPVLYPRKGQHLLRERRDQDGFALIAVLAVIAITAVTIGALLGMMLTAIKITENQQRDARQARAADGAVTAAINQLRMNQTNAVDACLPGVPASAGLVLTFKSSERTDGATVKCRTAADELGASAGEIKLSGSEYQGAFLWKTWPWPSLQPSINTAKPTLVHKGASALKFNGNLSSQGGAAPLRDPAGTPALDVRGGYEQATQGIGAAAGSGGSCGALSGATADAATTVRASAGTKCGGPLLVPVSATQDYPIDPSTPTSPDPSALTDCPASSVITFSPGKYDQYDVSTLNKWFGRGDDSCKNKTFYFPYGRYWFDANTFDVNAFDAKTLISGDPVPDPSQHALIFDNPSSAFVFGKANGWDPAGAGATAANFPKACDPANPGASIILSGRTEFRHLAGRLAVCPYRLATGAATPYPALLQQATVPSQVTAKIKGGDMSFGCLFDGKLRCPDSQSFTATLSSGVTGKISLASLNVTGTENIPNLNGVESRSVLLKVTLADAAKSTCEVEGFGAPQLGRIATYDLLPCKDKKGANLITYGEQLDGATVEVFYKYTFLCLLDACGGSTEGYHGLMISNVAVVTDPWVVPAASVTAESPWEGIESAREDDRLFSYPSICPSVAQWRCIGSEGARFTSSFSMKYSKENSQQNFGGSVASSDSHLESLGVVVKQVVDEKIVGQQCFEVGVPANPIKRFCSKGSLVGQAVAKPTKTVIALTLNASGLEANRTVCTSETVGVSNQAGNSYFPLISKNLASCVKGGIPSPPPQTASALLDATLSFQYLDMECSPTPNGQCQKFVPAPIQYVGLVATSDSYSKVIRSQLTIDSAAAVPASGGAGGPASANFFGSAYLKNVALDLNWNGQASGASLFGGALQLNSLGSLMKATATTDVVCCTAPETNIRKVRLTASVDNEAKLSAVVALNRDLPTAAPVVLEWTVCGRNGNCSP